MMKEVIRAMETGLLPQIGLLAFFFAFVMILVWVFKMTKDESDAAGKLPLFDGSEDQSKN